MEEQIAALYESFLISEEVQEFAKHHPGQRMTVSLEIKLKGKGKKCVLTMRDPGYIIESSSEEN